MLSVESESYLIYRYMNRIAEAGTVCGMICYGVKDNQSKDIFISRYTVCLAERHMLSCIDRQVL